MKLVRTIMYIWLVSGIAIAYGFVSILGEGV